MCFPEGRGRLNPIIGFPEKLLNVRSGCQGSSYHRQVILLRCSMLDARVSLAVRGRSGPSGAGLGGLHARAMGGVLRVTRNLGPEGSGRPRTVRTAIEFNIESLSISLVPMGLLFVLVSASVLPLPAGI